MEETRVPRKIHQHPQVTDRLCVSEKVVEYTSPWVGIELTDLVVISNDSIGKWKSNCYTTCTCMFSEFTSFWDIVSIARGSCVQSDIHIVLKWGRLLKETFYNDLLLVLHYIIWSVTCITLHNLICYLYYTT